LRLALNHQAAIIVVATTATVRELRLALNHQAAIIHIPLKPWKQGFFSLFCTARQPFSGSKKHQLIGVFGG
jgi:hypothetical protein